MWEVSKYITSSAIILSLIVSRWEARGSVTRHWIIGYSSPPSHHYHYWTKELVAKYNTRTLHSMLYLSLRARIKLNFIVRRDKFWRKTQQWNIMTRPEDDSKSLSSISQNGFLRPFQYWFKYFNDKLEIGPLDKRHRQWRLFNSFGGGMTIDY